jgi:glutamate racemase
MGDGVKLVSSAHEVAKVVRRIIEEKDLGRDSTLKPVYRYYTSDSVEKFEPLCNLILGGEASAAEKIDIEKY